MTQKRSAGCALARRRNMSQATALGARMCQGTFFFVSEKENALLVTGTVNSKENSKREKFSSEYDFPRGKSCVIL